MRLRGVAGRVALVLLAACPAACLAAVAGAAFVAGPPAPEPTPTTAAPTAPDAPPATAAPRIIDLMPAFWSFWDATEGQPAAERVAALRARVIAPEQAFFDQVIGVPSDDRLAQYLESLTPAIPALHRISMTFPGQLGRGLATFTAAYPDLDPGLAIYVGPSLFSSSGQVRYLDGRRVVMYGLDVLAYVLPDVADRTPDIHHELFHAWHYRVNHEIAEAAKSTFNPERTTPLYYDLWVEGLALLAVRRLDPDAPLADVLASPRLAAEGAAVLPRVAAELRDRLDTSRFDVVRDYFFLSTKRTDFPPRIAYYVGLRMAEEVARHGSIQFLARLEGRRLRRAVEKGLDALARGPDLPPPAGPESPAAPPAAGPPPPEARP